MTVMECKLKTPIREFNLLILITMTENKKHWTNMRNKNKLKIRKKL